MSTKKNARIVKTFGHLAAHRRRAFAPLPCCRHPARATQTHKPSASTPCKTTKTTNLPARGTHQPHPKGSKKCTTKSAPTPSRPCARHPTRHGVCHRGRGGPAIHWCQVRCLCIRHRHCESIAGRAGSVHVLLVIVGGGHCTEFAAGHARWCAFLVLSIMHMVNAMAVVARLEPRLSDPAER